MVQFLLRNEDMQEHCETYAIFLMKRLMMCLKQFGALVEFSGG